MRSTVAPLASTHELVEQAGLADTGLTAHDHAAGRPVPRPLEQLGQLLPLQLAADQHASTVPARGALASRRTRRFGRGDRTQQRRR